ncbi:MAG: DUF4412 domain-containing protein [Deltaproteobacteria bacterium]|nr:DUF4412 domain-containing protein [Deltaproteobacteria bacterium]
MKYETKRYIARYVNKHVFLTLSQGFAKKISEFSADQVHMDASGKIDHTGKIFFTPEKIRMEGLGIKGDSGGGQENMVLIFRKDQNVQRILNSKKLAYLEKNINEEEMDQFSNLSTKDEVKDLGIETIQGYKCRKKQVTSTVQIMGYKKTVQSIQWVSDEFPMPLKTQEQNGSVIELRNIKVGRQPAEIFEVPASYKKVDTIFELVDVSSEKTEGKDARKSMDASEKKNSGLPEGVKKHLPKGFKFPGTEDKQ